jgi:NAD(P)-dependent dehydrogenase (short-subunit alcohol dehydrogenase family)
MAKATLRNRTAVVTGGANGIGRSMARAFAKAELSVAVADVDVDGAEAVASEIRSGGGDAIALTCDVSRFAEVEALAAEVRERLGPVGMLCNNAGIGGGLHPSMDVLDVGDWESVIGVNLWGVVHGVRAFTPRMIEDAAGGHIVNTASMAAFLPAAGTGPYTTTKFAVVGLSEVLRAELAPHEIGVSVLCPGPFDTGIWGGDQTSDTGGDPAVLGPRVLAAVEANEPFIFTHPEFAPMVSDRFDRIATRVREAGQAMLRAVTAAG